MQIFNYSGDDFDLYGQFGGDTETATGPWRAPQTGGPIDATVRIPGSKSLTNRELILAALAQEPTVLRGALLARDTRLMISALEKLGVEIEVNHDRHGTPTITVTPPDEFSGAVDIDCGLAGTVMRFVPTVAALALGPVTFDGDEGARLRPMGGTLQALRALGVQVRDDGRGRLPFSIFGTGSITGGDIEIDASASSQFVSGLLLSAPRFDEGLTLRHTGEGLPSLPHIEMTLATLRARGVDARAIDERTWRVEPGPIRGGDIVIEPDLSNAAPFLIAAVVCGGTVRIPDWPTTTTQVGDHLRELLAPFGAECTLDDRALICTVATGIAQGAEVSGADLNLEHAGELAPNLAALLALCHGPSTLTGIAHLRGHETDRLAALAAELSRVGCEVTELEDGLHIVPGARNAALWQCYADHRMATSGAIVGLVTDGITLDDIECTAKTLPDFAEMWCSMLGVDAAASADTAARDEFIHFDVPQRSTPSADTAIDTDHPGDAR